MYLLLRGICQVFIVLKQDFLYVVHCARVAPACQLTFHEAAHILACLIIVLLVAEVSLVRSPM